MPLKFKNIRSNEVRVAETEELIAALYNSSDKGPNANNSQDFGWRIAPEVIIQMRRIMRDGMELERIANRYKKPLDEVGELDVLRFISDTTLLKDAPVAEDGDYEDDYHAEIARLEKKERAKAKALEAKNEVVDIDLDLLDELDKSPDEAETKK